MWFYFSSILCSFDCVCVCACACACVCVCESTYCRLQNRQEYNNSAAQYFLFITLSLLKGSIFSFNISATVPNFCTIKSFESIPIIKKPVPCFVIPINWLVVIWVSRILVLNPVLHSFYFTNKISSKILPLKFLMRLKLLHIPHRSMTKWRKIFCAPFIVEIIY